MKPYDSSGARNVSSVTRNDTFEFRVSRPRVFWRVMHLDKTNVGQGSKNSAQETADNWNPPPIVSRAVKKKHTVNEYRKYHIIYLNCERRYELIAQLVEHYTGIAEVMGSNPVQA